MKTRQKAKSPQNKKWSWLQYRTENEGKLGNYVTCFYFAWHVIVSLVQWVQWLVTVCVLLAPVILCSQSNYLFTSSSSICLYLICPCAAVTPEFPLGRINKTLSYPVWWYQQIIDLHSWNSRWLMIIDWRKIMTALINHLSYLTLNWIFEDLECLCDIILGWTLF